MENLKLPRGATFLHFYYKGLSINSSEELALYIKLNQWYFNKMDVEIQEQFRNMYRNLKKQEAKNVRNNGIE